MSRGIRLTRARLAALLTGCVLVVGVAFGAGWAFGAAPRPETAPSIPAPPSPPAQPPYRHYQYMNGVSVDQVTAVARARGYTCSGPRAYGQYLSEWFCRRDAGTVHGVVTIQARDTTRIWLIQAAIDDGGRPPSHDAVLPLLTALAPLPLQADAGAASQAAAWVSANLDQPADTEFGELTYAIALDGSCLFTIVGKW